MRRIVTSLVWTVLLLPIGVQSAPGADMKILTPPASEEATTSQTRPRAEAAFEDIRPSGPPIAIRPDSGTLVHLPVPARTVFVANQEIADVQVQEHTPEYIFLTAKKPGATVLYAADREGHVLLNNEIIVRPGPVVTIHGSKVDTGEPPPPPNFLVLPLQAASVQPPAPAPGK